MAKTDDRWKIIVIDQLASLFPGRPQVGGRFENIAAADGGESAFCNKLGHFLGLGWGSVQLLSYLPTHIFVN